MCRPNNVMCFNCGEWFSKTTPVNQCKVCGDFRCPFCRSCMCSLTKGEKKVVMAMIRTYERFIHEVYKGEEYDFKQHEKIEHDLFDKGRNKNTV